MKILICGPKGSGKKTLAEPLKELLKDSCTIVVESCTNQNQVNEIDPEYIVWMDTLDRSTFKPDNVDYHIAAWFNDTHTQLADVVIRHIARKEKGKL
ncbi:MAG: hypothetical protein CBC57_01705 [Euryarchaeota archaeon TMED97]|nr:MAG: hypothetical protein CBC57_01705 [Euryarchaeota archaeon TMED97]|tara:strand:+ start:429 stop:719 length:291 start_codon:yes stop_codon:yes gene_type:complete